MNRVSQCVGGIAFVLACLMAWEAWQLSYYTFLGPGPGFFGVWLGGAAALLSMGIFVAATRAKPVPIPEDYWPPRDGIVRIVGVNIALVFMAFALEPLGYVLTSFAFLMASMWLMGERRLAVSLPVACAGSVGVYFVFVHLLLTPLPPGILAF